MDCAECIKLKDGWCRYRGLTNTAAVRPDRRTSWCRPVARHTGLADIKDNVQPTAWMRRRFVKYVPAKKEGN